MIVYVLFITVGYSSFQYEFKDKKQCENTITVFKKKFDGSSGLVGLCMEIKK